MSIQTDFHSKRLQRGFTLIEALVGAVVLSVGLLSIASLQVATMNSVGDSKARSEAMQIAETQMESLRSGYSNRDDFNNLDDIFDGQSVVLDGPGTALPDGTTTDYVGTNAEYTIQWEVDAVDSDASGAPLLLLAGIRVSWQGSTDGQGEEQAVTIASFLNWDNPAGGAAASDAGDPNGGGTLLSPPTGRAFQGGNVYQDGDGNADIPDGAEANTIDIGNVSIDDGTYTYDANGATELIGEDGRVLLTIPNGKAFSTIEGRLYSDIPLNEEDFAITASDASACQRLFLDDGTFDGELEVFYRCYVGPAWYGNIGVLRFDTVKPSEKLLVGRPGQDKDSTRWDSLHPTTSAVRSYRGFKETDDPEFPISTGIGIDPDSGGYTSRTLSNHDFLLQDINPKKETEEDVLESHTPLFDDGVGEGFCFTGWILDPDPGYCPNVGGEGASGGYQIVVTIASGINKFGSPPQYAGLADGATLDDLVSVNAGVCTDTTQGNTVSITCQGSLSDTGSQGEWKNSLAFVNLAANVRLCDATYISGDAPGSTITVSGDGIDLDGLVREQSEIEIEALIEATCP